MNNDLSLEELQELHEKGLVPKASKELVEYFNSLMRFVHRVHEQTGEISHIMQRGNFKGAALYNQLADELEKLFVRGKQLDLGQPYNMEQLSSFRNLYHDFVNNDLLAYYTQLESVGALTDNVTENIKRLYIADDDFYKEVDKEHKKNQELSNSLKEAESVQTKTSYGFSNKPVIIKDEKLKEPEINSVKQQLNQQTQSKNRQMTADDIVQSQEDDKRKLPQEQKPQNNIKTHENLIAALQRIDEMVDRKHSNQSFKNMMNGLKELKQMVPDEYVDAYRAILKEVKEHRNTENGVLKLSSEINWQIQEMRDADKMALEKAKIDKQKKSQMSPVEKGNKFKEGIVNVLNKSRDEKAQNRVQGDKEKQDAFVEMLRRKKMKGLVDE